jgi:peptidoglycan-N-acetylglucosamine deacetylase
MSPGRSIPAPSRVRSPVKTTLLSGALLAAILLSGPAPAGAHERAQPTVTLTVPQVFSPNADGFKDTLRATISVNVPVTLTIQIVGPRGVTVFSDAPGISVQAGPVRFRWNGKTGPAGQGPVAADGRYTLRATAVDAGGAQAVASAPVVVDTQPPRITWGSLQPTRLKQGPLFLRFWLGDLTRMTVKLSVVDQAGNPVATGPPSLELPGRVSFRWPRNHAPRLDPGAYRMTLKATDDVGNASVSAPRAFLVDHPVRARVVARFLGVGRHIALTFDDCLFPNAWTSILDTLKRNHIKATFFCPGKQVLAFPTLARRTVAEGHAIGSHGWDHANFGFLSPAAAEQRLYEDRDVWWNLARVSATPYFRPPYGSYKASTMAAAGRTGYSLVVLWDVDPRDWTRPGSAAIEQRVVSHTRPGSIVLMHVLDQTAAALPSIIKQLRARHFLMVSLPALERIGTPSPGGWPTDQQGSRTSGA